MRTTPRHIFCVLLLTACVVGAARAEFRSAQPAVSDQATDRSSDSATAAQPEDGSADTPSIDTLPAAAVDWNNLPPDTSILRFVPTADWLAASDSATNVVSDPGNSLKPFFEKLKRLRNGGQGVVTILHIGDSHVQAGFLTGRLREWFQQDFGNAGRGLVAPLRLAGTNEPADYAITSANRWTCFRCAMTPQNHPVGLTGMVAASPDSVVRFTIGAREPFSIVRAFHHPQAPALFEPDSLTTGMCCTAENSPYTTLVTLNQAVRQVTLTAPIVDPAYNMPVYYGFSLENGESGVLYQAVGINGITFEHLNRNPDILTQSAALCPDLIVVSLGTNDSWGNNFVEDRVNAQIDRFFTQLRKTHPDVPVMLTTPMEVYRRQYIRGRRQLAPNANTPRTVELIRAAAQTYGAALWDFYAAAGGEGSNAEWLGRQLMQRDRVHFTRAGYELQADMLYGALVDAYNATTNGNGIEFP